MAARVLPRFVLFCPFAFTCNEEKTGVCDNPRPGLGCNLLLGYCFLWLRCHRLNGHRPLCFAALLGPRWGEDGLGFGKEVELALARNADVSGEGKAKRKARQLVVGGVVDGGKQNLFGAALFVLVADVLGQIVGEGVGVKVDDGAEQSAELGCCEGFRGVLKDALEDCLPLLAQLLSALVLGFLLLLFALELLAAFFGSAVFFRLVLLSALLI